MVVVVVVVVFAVMAIMDYGSGSAWYDITSSLPVNTKWWIRFMTDRRMIYKLAYSSVCVLPSKLKPEWKLYWPILTVLKRGWYWLGGIPLNNTDVENCDDPTIIGWAILLWRFCIASSRHTRTNTTKITQKTTPSSCVVYISANIDRLITRLLRS